MRKNIFIFSILSVCLLNGCSEDNNNVPSISNEEQAKAAFLKIHGLWTSVLKTALTKEEQDYTGAVLENTSGGKAVVNGSFSESSASSSSSSSASSITDVTITFQQYTSEGVTLDGILRFFDSYRYRYACSSSGCASSTHTFVSYSSEGRTGIINPPITIEFEYNGKRFRDTILLDAEKEYSSFQITLTNGAGQLFTFRH